MFFAHTAITAQKLDLHKTTSMPDHISLRKQKEGLLNYLESKPSNRGGGQDGLKQILAGNNGVLYAEITNGAPGLFSVCCIHTKICEE